MLFTRKIDPRCAYCKHGEVLDEHQVICAKRGLSPFWFLPPIQLRTTQADPLLSLWFPTSINLLRQILISKGLFWIDALRFYFNKNL